MADTRGGADDRPSVADGVAVAVNLVLTDRTLLQATSRRFPAARPRGLGRATPADPGEEYVTRRCRDGPNRRPPTPTGRQVWLRRLYTHPATGELVALESRAKRFPEALREFLVLRDQTCRTPWCDAPVRHGDHVVPHAQGGPTSAAQRSRAVRGVQLHQGSTRLGGPTHPRQPGRPPPGGDHHPHRTPLPIPTTTPTRQRPQQSPPSRIEVVFARHVHAA